MIQKKSKLFQRLGVNITRRNIKSHIEDDGCGRKESTWESFLNKFNPRTPGTLILIRHGESQANTDKKFTGWIDSDLSSTGIREIEHAARLLLERGHTIDITYTSLMKRAIRSCWLIQKELDQVFRPIVKSWRLNERMYGALEGVSKPDLASLMGEEQVQKWRAGLNDRPPPMTEDHVHWHGKERKYLDIPLDLLPRTESLQDTINRTLPLWYSHILLDLKAGRNVMVVAHTNSLRGIIQVIDRLDLQQIQRVGIPNGIPLVYKFDKDMCPIRQWKAVPPLSGEYLEKRGLLHEALAREEELARRIEGYKEEIIELQSSPHLTPGQASTASQAAVKSLTKLEDQRKLLNQLILETGGLPVEDENNSNGRKKSNSTTPLFHSTSRHHSHPQRTHTGAASPNDRTANRIHSKDYVAHRAELQNLDNPLLVIIRHGKTEHNKLGLFTGWEDAPLAEEGRKEARDAGKLLQRHGIQFDIVYTSWLSRAIETAWLLTEELDDSLWLPVVKTWRLNERMYGALTGLSKKMIKQRHGTEQFTKWRRGYDTPPPLISSFSHYYPGNDDRYVNYVQDIPISLFETLIRSLAHGRLEIHRKFPKAESLKNCMERTIPYYRDVIVPQSLALGKSVLIASSENAIRGLLMHLCNIPTNQIHQVEIPTGLPLIFDKRINRIRLLEDDTDEQSPFTKHNFGDSPDLLFKPDFMSQERFSNSDIQIVRDPDIAHQMKRENAK